MTIAPKGRTYINTTWVVDPDIINGKRPSRHDHLHYERDELVIEEYKIVVPNGKWVVEDGLYGKYSWLVGIGPRQLRVVTVETPSRVRHIHVSDRPFGFVVAEDEDIDRSANPVAVRPNGGKSLVYARQVHECELSHGVRTPHLNYVRQPLAEGHGLHMSARERRRGQRGWIKFVDLGEVAACHCNPDKMIELILGYWQFSGHKSPDGGRLVDVAWGSGLDIKSGNAQFDSLTREQFRKECSDPSEVWVGRGFAYTILRLQALGVPPEPTQLA